MAVEVVVVVVALITVAGVVIAMNLPNKPVFCRTNKLPFKGSPNDDTWHLSHTSQRRHRGL